MNLFKNQSYFEKKKRPSPPSVISHHYKTHRNLSHTVQTPTKRKGVLNFTSPESGKQCLQYNHKYASSATEQENSLSYSLPRHFHFLFLITVPNYNHRRSTILTRLSQPHPPPLRHEALRLIIRQPPPLSLVPHSTPRDQSLRFRCKLRFSFLFRN